MENFDLKKFLVENGLTINSRLVEDFNSENSILTRLQQCRDLTQYFLDEFDFNGDPTQEGSFANLVQQVEELEKHSSLTLKTIDGFLIHIASIPTENSSKHLEIYRVNPEIFNPDEDDAFGIDTDWVIVVGYTGTYFVISPKDYESVMSNYGTTN